MPSMDESLDEPIAEWSIRRCGLVGGNGSLVTGDVLSKGISCPWPSVHFLLPDCHEVSLLCSIMPFHRDVLS
jgi:hypothetical protein